MLNLNKTIIIGHVIKCVESRGCCSSPLATYVFEWCNARCSAP